MSRRVAIVTGADVTVYHLASRITIESRVTPSVREVNVEGTREVIGACLRNGARRLVYVSSVHAIPEPDPGTGEDGGEPVIVEPDHFDPELVVGGYAKTKARPRSWCWTPTGPPSESAPARWRRSWSCPRASSAPETSAGVT